MSTHDSNSHGSRLLAGVWLFACIMSFAAVIAHLSRQQAARDLVPMVEVIQDGVTWEVTSD